MSIHFHNVNNQNLYIMIQLIGSYLNEQTDVYTFFYHNTETNWYYEMYCRNSFLTDDMHMRAPRLSREEFVQLAGNRLI